jgi:hypothetical protein
VVVAGAAAPQFFCAQATRCCSAACSFGLLKAFAAAWICAICAAVGILPGLTPAFTNACRYVVNAAASVWKSPRTSDGAAFAYAWKSFASLERRVSALPDVDWSAWASFVPRASSCAQFFDVAKLGVDAELVVVVAADVELVAGDTDFFFEPPQPAARTTQTRADTAKSLEPTARRV